MALFIAVSYSPSLLPPAAPGVRMRGQVWFLLRSLPSVLDAACPRSVAATQVLRLVYFKV